MKTTNTKHIINEKLQGVDLPDMQASWDQMDTLIDSQAPVSTGFSAFIAKYKLFLNVFLVSLVIGLVGLYVKSTIQKTGKILAVSSVGDDNSQSLLNKEVMQYVAAIDHNYDLPLPAEPMFTKQVAPRLTPTTQKINLPKRGINILNINSRPFSLDFLTGINESDTQSNLEIVYDGLNINDQLLPKISFVKNEVGLKFQTALHPNSKPTDVLRNSGYGLYARRFFNSQMALHLEIGYNPVPIRSITYVEKYELFKNNNYHQTDSAIVNGLRYVTVPINLYYTTPQQNFSVTFGPQFSFLSGLNGDLYQNFDYPTATEDQPVIRNTKIRNRGGFNATDIAVNIEVAFKLKHRLAMGCRYQLSVSDFSNDKLSASSHNFNTLQLKAEWMLSK